MDGDWLDLHVLRCFLQVARERNVPRAADALGMETAMVSGAVRQLEDDLGVELVVWGSRPLRLTPAGTHLVLPARHLVTGVEHWSWTVWLHRHRNEHGPGCG